MDCLSNVNSVPGEKIKDKVYMCRALREPC